MAERGLDGSRAGDMEFDMELPSESAAGPKKLHTDWTSTVL
jgi:hypothetical protein